MVIIGSVSLHDLVLTLLWLLSLSLSILSSSRQHTAVTAYRASREGQNTERNTEDRDWMKDRWREREGAVGREKGSDKVREEPTERWMQRGRRGEEMV